MRAAMAAPGGRYNSPIGLEPYHRLKVGGREETDDDHENGLEENWDLTSPAITVKLMGLEKMRSRPCLLPCAHSGVHPM